ncbi:MAG: FIST N-terminal domain-containing protein [Cyanobacteria bacterium J06627_32]
MFKAAVGHGIDPDSLGAIDEALAQCQQDLGSDIPQAGILLAAVDFDYQLILDRIHQTYPDLLLVGGSSVGEMSSAMSFQQDSLTLMLFASDEVSFQTGIGYQAREDAIAAATSAVQHTLKDTDQSLADMKLCYALGEGIGIDAVALVKGLTQATHQSVPIVGGLTADDYQFKNTYQFFGSEVVQGAVVILTFFGNLKISCGVATGQQPTGKKATVTKSKSFTVYEIDGQPAQEFYTPYFGEEEVKIAGSGSALIGAIAVYEPQADNFYVRAPNGQTGNDGSVNYFGHVPEQATIQVTDMTHESLLKSAEDAFSKAKAAYPGSAPSAALMVSCVSRMKNLGTKVAEEYELAEAIIGKHLPSMGFYAYGEMSPFTGQNTSHFHNETFTALLLGTE